MTVALLDGRRLFFLARFGSEWLLAIAKGDGRLKVLALALAIANLVIWYSGPWIRNSFDALTGRLASPFRPTIVNGVQELLVYYDPWLARGVFPTAALVPVKVILYWVFNLKYFIHTPENTMNL